MVNNMNKCYNNPQWNETMMVIKPAQNPNFTWTQDV